MILKIFYKLFKRFLRILVSLDAFYRSKTKGTIIIETIRNMEKLFVEKRLWHRSNYHLDKKCLVNYVVALGCATST